MYQRWIKTRDGLPEHCDLVIIKGRSRDSSNPRSIIRLSIFNSHLDGEITHWFDAGNPSRNFDTDYDIEWWCRVFDPTKP